MKRIGFIKGNRVDFKDGFIVVPPFPSIMSLAEPDVYAESATPLYPIGTLLWYPGMGKKYRYAKAGTALRGTKVLVANGHYVPDGAGQVNVGGFYGSLSKAYDAGASEVNFTDTIDKAKDFYEGAHLLHFDAARNICFEDSYVISGPPAAITTPWSCTVKLYKPKKYAYVAADGIEIWCNPYSKIIDAGTQGGFVTMMGVPPIPVTNGYYFWLQTAGPVFITPNGWTTLCPGYAIHSRVAMTQETSDLITTQAASGAGYQVVGDLLARTLSGSADAYVNMNLDLGH